MKNTDREFYIENRGSQLFRGLVFTGSRESLISNLFGKHTNILDLKTLTDVIPVTEEHHGARKDVPVELIIGTENRSKDFSGCFYPKNFWMEERWTRVFRLMHMEGISEPLKLIEYGGYYFVRDGNHRVSVAIHSGIEFVTAEIVHYKIPVSLPDNLNRNNLELLFEKYRFYERTKIFDFIDEKQFQVNCQDTWKKLEKEIFVNSRSWFVRYYEREPVNGEFIHIWNEFYRLSVEHIRERSLLLLFPGRRETDVFVELVEYWNSYENPDSFWEGEIFEKFEKFIGRKRFILGLRRFLFQWIRMKTASINDIKYMFLHTTMINYVVPDFDLPVAGKKFFNLCYKQIYRINAKFLKEKSEKQLMIDDIDHIWYKSFYSPVIERYRKFLYPMSFEKFYMKFSKHYYKKIVIGNVSIENCFEEFEKKIV